MLWIHQLTRVRNLDDAVGQAPQAPLGGQVFAHRLHTESFRRVLPGRDKCHTGFTCRMHVLFRDFASQAGVGAKPRCMAALFWS